MADKVFVPGFRLPFENEGQYNYGVGLSMQLSLRIQICPQLFFSYR